MLYDDSLVQGLEGKANVESHLNSILSYSQYWMRHTTLEIKFELKMESLHMAGINIEPELTGDGTWFAGPNPAYNFLYYNDDFPYTITDHNSFPFNIVITIWYDNQSNSSGFYRNAWGPYEYNSGGQPVLPWKFCPSGINPGGSSFLRFLGPDGGGLETTSKLFVRHLGYMLGAVGEWSQSELLGHNHDDISHKKSGSNSRIDSIYKTGFVS